MTGLTESQMQALRDGRAMAAVTTSDRDSVKQELIKLAGDLYQEGYHSGISGDNGEKWLAAWAEAMMAVSTGQPYTDQLVIELFNRPE